MTDNAAIWLFFAVVSLVVGGIMGFAAYQEHQSRHNPHGHKRGRPCARCIESLELECGIVEPRAVTRPWVGRVPPPPERPVSLPDPTIPTRW